MAKTDDNIRVVLNSKENVGGVPARLVVEVGTNAEPLPKTVIDFSTIPYVISNPGLYTLDQDWKISVNNDDLFSFIEVTSDKVTIDFNGHRVSFQGALPIIGIDLEASGVMIRNGVIELQSSMCNGWPGIRGNGNDLRISDMLIFARQAECGSWLGIDLSGIEHEVIRVDTSHALCDPMIEDCSTNGGASVVVGDFSLVKDSELYCESGDCLTAGSYSIISNNRVSTDIRVNSDNLVVNNITKRIIETGGSNTIENNWVK